jgi:hypothetical protein
MTEPQLGDMRFAKSERGWYDEWQIWNGTTWVSVSPNQPELGETVLPPEGAVEPEVDEYGYPLKLGDFYAS